MLDMLKKYSRQIWLASTVISSAAGAYMTNRYLETLMEPPEVVEGLPPPGQGRKQQEKQPVTERPRLSGEPGATPSANGSTVPVADAGAPPGADPSAPGTAPEAAPGEAPPLDTSQPVLGASLLPLMEYEPILTRNLFDSANSLSFTPENPVQQVDSGPPPTPPLDARLFATVSAEPASYSWAILTKNEDTAPQETFRVGDDVYGQGTLVRVLRNKVIVRRPDGAEQTLERWTGNANPIPGAQAAVGTKPDPNGLGEGVRMVGENKFEIDAKEIQKALDNMEAVTKSARIVPSFENGSPVGFKVFRIKPDSFYNKLGIRNGDVITKLNGFDMTSTEKALQMFQILRSEKQLSLELTRRGQKMNMEYTIR